MTSLARIVISGLCAVFLLATEFGGRAAFTARDILITGASAEPFNPDSGKNAKTVTQSGEDKKSEPSTAPPRAAAEGDDSAQLVVDDTRPTESELRSLCSSVPKASKIASEINLNFREKIGQMLIFGFQGVSAAQQYPRTLRDQLKRGEIGGVLFLKHNVESAAGVKGLAKLFRQVGSKLPPLIMVDQEGGAVQRFGPKVTVRPLPTAAAVAARMNWRDAYDLYNRQAKLLKEWGFNVNLGPVLDVNVEPNNPVIGRIGRSFSSKPRVVEDYGRAFVLAHRAAGLGTALKHFPGHGSSKTDSHKGFVDISETWQMDRELAPFRSLIGQGCADMVLIGHVFLDKYQNHEGDNDPATFSKKIITGLLRNELGFKGVVITDDLEMAAIRKNYDFEESLKKAIRAGNNLLLIGNTVNPRPMLAKRVIEVIYAEAEKDPEFKRLVLESAQRITKFKSKFMH